jgi:hypothetical protein
MANVFRPRLDILPPAQQRLWPELAQTPRRSTAVRPLLCAWLGNFDLGQVEAAEITQDTRIHVASLLDLAGMKVAVVTQRAELRDYLDIYALLTKANIPLSKMLAAASVIYGDQFNTLTALKAIAYHGDANLAALPATIRTYLSEAVQACDVTDLPLLKPVRLRSHKR